MAKLYFRYGTMGSAKSLNLLAVAHNYQLQGKKVFLIKPKLDVRFGQGVIKSRAGLEKEADLLVEEQTNLDSEKLSAFDCILVDEAQFLSSHVIEQLRKISQSKSVPVICYGLRSDFRTHLFEGSKRLLELADSIEEIKTTCAYCAKKAVFNMKILNGQPTLQGPSIDLGAEEKYVATCSPCYYEKVK